MQRPSRHLLVAQAATDAGAQASGNGNSPVRYTVLEVHESPDEKVLRVINKGSGQELAVHLHDGWVSTPVDTGDTVHVLAHVDIVDGQAHAVCNHGKGQCSWRSVPLAQDHCTN